MNFLLLDFRIQSIVSHLKPFLHCLTTLVAQKMQPWSTILSCSNAVNKLFQTFSKSFIHMEKNLSVADMLIRSFTETYSQFDQLEHIQLPHFAILQNQTLKHVHY